MMRLSVSRRLASSFALVLSVACGNTPPPAAPAPEKEAIQVEGLGSMARTPALAAAASEAALPIPIRYDDPSLGNRNAYVTLVVFSDFQCPFCARLATTIEELRIKYGPDMLRVVFKHQPLEFHDKAAFAAEVAAGVLELGGQDAFWKFHQIAFSRARTMSQTELVAWAVETGVNEAALTRGLEGHRWQSKVASDIELAKSLDVVGTPASFINGVSVGGAQPFDKFVEVIDAEIMKARSLVERGVPRESVYARMVVTNLAAKPAPEAKSEPIAKQEDTAIYKVAVGSAPTRGPATALVTIVEFSDFQCPFCSRVQPTLERIRKEYGDKVRIVWKDEPLPFHPHAVPAANFARSARSQKGVPGFWAAHDKLFSIQPHMEDKDLEALAHTLGLNPGVTMSAVRNDTYRVMIEADKAQADSVKASGTPHFFINGRRLVGAQPFEKFKDVIDAELVRAEDMLKTGVSRTALYAELTKGGISTPPVAAAAAATGPLVPPVARGHQGVAPTSLLTQDLKTGTGAAVKNGDKVRVHYVGTLVDGTEFDSTRKSGRSPFEVEVGRGMIIKGWEQGLLGMRVGGRRKLTIPPDLAYGAAGRPPTIPAKATIVFDIELLEIK